VARKHIVDCARPRRRRGGSLAPGVALHRARGRDRRRFPSEFHRATIRLREATRTSSLGLTTSSRCPRARGG